MIGSCLADGCNSVAMVRKNIEFKYFNKLNFISMKKTLLLSGALLMAAAPAFADVTPAVYPDAPFMGISSNGKYTTFSLQGMLLSVLNLEDPSECSVYYDEVYQMGQYIPGYGTCVADDGSTVGNATIYDAEGNQWDQAVIYNVKGDLTVLSVPDKDQINLAHGITPDGSRICGNVGLSPFSMDSQMIMQVPVIWNRNEDGTYGDPVMLPYPAKDFLGEVPQMITALAISSDGKTVAGEVVSNSGWWTYPIIYTLGDNGEWSYSLPFLNELFFTNPEIYIPANPGNYPLVNDFMTQEELDAHAKALEEWNNTPYEDRDWSKYPNIQNFMSDEEKEVYAAAVDKYYVDLAAYQNAVDAATAGSVTFEFNSVVLAPDGKSVAYNYNAGGVGPLKPAQKSPKYSPLSKSAREGEELATSTVFVLNLEDGKSYKTYTCEEGLTATCAAKDGKYVAYSGNSWGGYPCAMVIDPEKGLQPLQEYFPAIKSWVDDNLMFAIETYDPETWEPVEKDMVVTGLPFCTPDMNTVTTYINELDPTAENAGQLYRGFVFSGLTSGSGVNVIETGKKAADVEYYDLNGMRINKPAKGITLRKVKYTDGTTATEKVALR